MVRTALSFCLSRPLVTSLAVANEVPERDDVVIHNEAVRDDQGRIIGCRSLGHVNKTAQMEKAVRLLGFGSVDLALEAMMHS